MTTADTILIVVQVFIYSSLLNLIWEFAHCTLYKHYKKKKLKHIWKRLTFAALKDGFRITIIYGIGAAIFMNINILTSKGHALVFIVLSLVFAYFGEGYALKKKKWQYTKFMPRVLGVGITPLFQLLITGLIAFLLIFML